MLVLDPRHAVAMSSVARAYRARGDNLNAEQWFRKWVVAISVCAFSNVLNHVKKITERT